MSASRPDVLSTSRGVLADLDERGVPFHSLSMNVNHAVSEQPACGIRVPTAAGKMQHGPLVW